jgi:toxin ParE1/3/4
MKLVWRPQALAELAAIIEYIERDSPAGAARVRAQILHSVSFLLEWPDIGREGRRGYRELVVPRSSYVVIFRHGKREIRIHRVRHAARKR